MKRVRVNPITCEGHGLCAELLPERIQLDEWGFPIVDPEPMSGEVARHAARAVEACPTLALLLENAQGGSGRHQEERRSRNQ